MDAYARKKATGGFGFSTRGATLAFRDPNHEDRHGCNRSGRTTQFNSTSGSYNGKPEKSKYTRVSFRSTCSKVLTGSSSRSFSPSTELGKANYGRMDRASPRMISIAESSNRQEKTADPESSDGFELTEEKESFSANTHIQAVLHDSVDTTDTLSTCTTASSSRLHKPVAWKAASNQDTFSASFSRRPTTFRSITQTAKPVSHGVKNLSCTSMSDVLPPECSPSDFGSNRRVDMIRKRFSNGESSSSGGKNISGSLTGGVPGSAHSGHSAPSISLPDGSLPNQSSRRVRNRPASRDGAVSVRTRRPSTGETRMRLPEQGDDDTPTLSEPITTPQLSESQISIHDIVAESSSRSAPSEFPPVFNSSFRQLGSSSRTGRNRSTPQPERSSTQIIHGPFRNRDGSQRFNIEGIAEVLLALERIEQDAELTYEQLLMLETNLLLGGLSYRDQHRDMRLDIDNMTYEELLALEEKMGTVSTALSEEAFVKCLRRTIHMSVSPLSGISDQGNDDSKCSICQEEYVTGDEVGKLACEHGYHVACIHQWLRLKNWCPICKAAACPSA